MLNVPRQTAARAVNNDDLDPFEKMVQDAIAFSAFEDILDKKVALLKDDLATKDDMRGLKGVIKD